MTHKLPLRHALAALLDLLRLAQTPDEHRGAIMALRQVAAALPEDLAHITTETPDLPPLHRTLALVCHRAGLAPSVVAGRMSEAAWQRVLDAMTKLAAGADDVMIQDVDDAEARWREWEWAWWDAAADLFTTGPPGANEKPRDP